jgi:hypothetical protein
VCLLFVRERVSSGRGSPMPVAFPPPEFHVLPGRPALSRPCRSLFLLDPAFVCPRIPFIDSRVPLICPRISLYLLLNRPSLTPESPFIDSGIALHRLPKLPFINIGVMRRFELCQINRPRCTILRQNLGFSNDHIKLF